MRNAENESPLRRVAAETRERAPETQQNLLHQVLEIVRVIDVSPGHAVEQLAVLTNDPLQRGVW